MIVVSEGAGRRALLRHAYTLVAALALLLAGCKDAELQAQQIADNARKVTADSVNDATAPLVDEGYRFRIEWPGEGWKLLDRDEASRIAPDASAGAVKLPGTFLVVIVERAPGMTVDQLVELVLANNTMIADREIESRETITFAGRDARRVVWTGRVEGVRFRWANTAFVHEGHAYQVLGWGPIETFDPGDLAPVLERFSILPGEVVGPAVEADTDRTGPGWRLRAGVFESAVSGVRVEPASGWRVVTGVALTTMNEDAEVGMESPALGSYIALLPERIGGVSAADYRSTMVAQLERNLGASTSEWKATVAGQPIVFAEIATSPLEFLLGTLVADGVGIQVLVWYPASARDAVRESLPAALARITILDSSPRAALRAELASAVDPQTHVGKSHSLRGGVFRDFAAKIAWRKPAGFWRLSAGDRPSTPRVESLGIQNLETGLGGHLVIEERPGVDALTWHAERVAVQAGKAGARQTVELANGEGHLTKVLAQNGELQVEIDIGTAVHGRYAIELVVFGHVDRMATAAADVRAVYGGLELADELSEVTHEGGEYVDARLGFAIRPPDGWSRVDETTADKQPLGTFMLWKDGRRELRLIAMNFGGAANDARFVTQLIEQGAREEMTKRLGAAKVGTRALAGMQAEHSSWSGALEEADLLIASHGDTVVAFISVNLGDAQLDEVLDSFRLLD